MVKRILYGGLGLLSLFLFAPSLAAAQSLSQDDQNSIYGDTVWYQPGGGAGSCSVSVSLSLSGNSTAQQAYNFFVQQGLGAIQAAAIVGNFYWESSGVTPTAVGGGGNSNTPVPGKAWGIAQWLGPRIDGTDGLEKFVSLNSLTISDLAAQLQFSWHEFHDGAYQKALSNLQAAKDIAGATNVVFMEYEGPNDSTLPKRIALAQQIYDQFSGSGGTSVAAPPLPGSVDCLSATGPGQNTQYIDGFTVYSQYDPQWASKPYGTSTIAASGCGPSAMAMIITALTGKSVTPDITALYADSLGLYVPGEGSSWGIAPDLAAHWGLKSAFIGKDSAKIAATLQSGGLVITSGQGPLPFTSGGHFLVIRGVAADGKWKVGDSGHSDTSSQEWDPQQLLTSMNSGSVYAITK